MTKYEKEIYDIINFSVEHLTIEQIFWQVKEEYPRVVLATIYNNVHRLKEAGLIRQISTEGMPDRYDRARKHDHLVCKRCGQLTDIVCEDLTASLQKTLGGSFLYYDLKVFHLCPSCREQTEFHKPNT